LIGLRAVGESIARARRAESAAVDLPAGARKLPGRIGEAEFAHAVTRRQNELAATVHLPWQSIATPEQDQIVGVDVVERELDPCLLEIHRIRPLRKCVIGVAESESRRVAGLADSLGNTVPVEQPR